MTVAQAVVIFQNAGLGVQCVPPTHISSYCDPYEPPHVLRDQGVEVCFSFGFSLDLIDDSWFLRRGPPQPSERFSRLEDAVARGLEVFRAYRERSAH